MGLTQTDLVYGPWWWEDSRLQGISDGSVTSCLFKERVVATRRGREAQAEVGVGGGDTDKARTGHGRGREAWWQRWQRTHGLLSEGW